ncbi:hypothetical protein GCM10007884_26830 [Methylobacterium brachythecii]|uniref:Secreted protein n=1 Tax=Methylobacterium brachythecii TaxID=1176177 RepID=A0ABQ6D7Y8_9HYPH|nr:hypothetical protein GCM10007884_26830 [Methylobacterium brachythecii]
MSVFLLLGLAAKAGSGKEVAAKHPTPRAQPQPRNVRRFIDCIVLAFPTGQTRAGTTGSPASPQLRPMRTDGPVAIIRRGSVTYR